VSSAPDVYGSAARPGWRTRVASRGAAAARRRRYERFEELTGADEQTRILDIGCGALGLRALAPTLDITGLDIVIPDRYPGPFVQADATQHLPFEDDAFDLVYCSSVVEHIAPELRAPFAAEIKRVARGYYVQTPAWEFPIEPHSLLPFAHWLPKPIQRPYWRLGVAGEWERIEMLRRSDMATLFGEPIAEHVGPLVKSWISVSRSAAADQAAAASSTT
jgi:SAM-dependent methyltransferase